MCCGRIYFVYLVLGHTFVHQDMVASSLVPQKPEKRENDCLLQSPMAVSSWRNYHCFSIQKFLWWQIGYNYQLMVHLEVWVRPFWRWECNRRRSWGRQDKLQERLKLITEPWDWKPLVHEECMLIVFGRINYFFFFCFSRTGWLLTTQLSSLSEEGGLLRSRRSYM